MKTKIVLVKVSTSRYLRRIARYTTFITVLLGAIQVGEFGPNEPLRRAMPFDLRGPRAFAFLV